MSCPDGGEVLVPVELAEIEGLVELLLLLPPPLMLLLLPHPATSTAKRNPTSTEIRRRHGT
jgi:hypothetical protein